MKTGTDMQTLAQRIVAQAKSKKDYAMDTRNLSMTVDGKLAFSVAGQLREVKPTDLCLNQIGNRVGIPRAFLSHKYRPFDNVDLVNAILPKLTDAGCES